MTERCPHCARDIHVANRVTGDTVWCPCGASLTVMFRPGGTALISRFPLAALAPVPETSAKQAPRRRRKGGQP